MNKKAFSKAKTYVQKWEKELKQTWINYEKEELGIKIEKLGYPVLGEPVPVEHKHLYREVLELQLKISEQEFEQLSEKWNGLEKYIEELEEEMLTTETMIKEVRSKLEKMTVNP